MRNLVIKRITELLRQFPDFLDIYDIDEEHLESMSNLELLDFYTEIVEDMSVNNPEQE